MFFCKDGLWKSHKRGRTSYAALMAEGLADPDEIWLWAREVPSDASPGQFYQALTRGEST